MAHPEDLQKTRHIRYPLSKRNRSVHAPRVVRIQIVNLHHLFFWGVALYLLLSLVHRLTGPLLLFATGMFMAVILDPIIRWLTRRGFRRGFAVTALALLLILTTILAATFALPPLIEQVNAFAAAAPTQARRLQERMDDLVERYPFLRQQIQSNDVASSIASWGQQLVVQIGQFWRALVGILFGTLLLFFTTLYTLASPKPLLRGLLGVFPGRYRFMTRRIVVRLVRQYQAWTRAILLLMLIVGLSAGIGLQALGIENALVFGVIAGLGEAIPVIGPLLSALPPIITTLAVDPARAAWVAALFAGIQFLENYILVPRIMGSVLHLHPVSILFAAVTLGILLGPPAVLFAAPLCVTIRVIYEEWCRHHYFAISSHTVMDSPGSTEV
ncbi:MAG: AI-2E family transporter [Chloroherpetonaceae bacterium]|nr:AI-2E family transporter [Chthonomonadaceae bacterium]MDW8208252.1 AI-2E family transporter [Chloroherpetonaceae bacterium]